MRLTGSSQASFAAGTELVKSAEDAGPPLRGWVVKLTEILVSQSCSVACNELIKSAKCAGPCCFSASKEVEGADPPFRSTATSEDW